MWLNRYRHTTCAYCEQSWDICHPPCVETLGRPEAQKVYASLLDAVAKGDLSAVISLGAKIPEFVAFSPSRNSIQVQSCSRDALIANLPVKDLAMLAMAARALPAVRNGNLALQSSGVESLWQLSDLRAVQSTSTAASLPR